MPASPRAPHASSPGESPQLVIFDLDLTLTDSARGIVSSFDTRSFYQLPQYPKGDLASHRRPRPCMKTLRAMR